MKRFVLALVLFPALAFGDDWVDQSADRDDRAFYRIVDTGSHPNRSLMMGCFRQASSVSVTMLQGDVALTGPHRQSEVPVMVWLELADGRTHRAPSNMEYMDNALIGSVLLAGQGMMFLAEATRILLTDSGGQELFSAQTSGGDAMVADFFRTCGL